MGFTEISYDVFEVMPDGNLIWRGSIDRTEDTLLKFRKFAEGRPNEFRLMQLGSNQIVATVDAQQTAPQQW